MFTSMSMYLCGQNEKTHSQAVSLEPLSLPYRGGGLMHWMFQTLHERGGGGLAGTRTSL